ncbi:MAG TPA: histidine kinase [Solirubrobacteraceae bacterium]|nr:histidine kinase [Solirubrobacteraceae bacterium]
MRATLRQRFGEGGLHADGRPMTMSRAIGMLVWLAFILVPVLDAVTTPAPTIQHALAIAGAVLFSSIYVWLVIIWFDERRHRRPYALTVALLALAVALTLADHPSWGFLFTYVAACAGLVVPSGYGMLAVLACAVVGAGATAAGGGTASNIIGDAAATIGVGLLLVLMRDLRVRNEELCEARAELARTAVAAERERFARDLHDLLGHTLSVIALKAELAGRLVAERPAQAAVEIGEVEQVARQALGEVRDAVSGYRKPTLEDELTGARMALSAAGIEADVERAPVALHPDAEAVLAWAVREGATNVIRHSGARRCRVIVSASDGLAAVEVVDNGSRNGRPRAVSGGLSNGGSAGHGIAGLTERAERVHGQVHAGRLPEGAGFRLSVSVPVGAHA